MRFIHRDDINGPQDGTGERPGLREPPEHLWRPPRDLLPSPTTSPTALCVSPGEQPLPHEAAGWGHSLLRFGKNSA